MKGKSRNSKWPPSTLFHCIYNHISWKPNTVWSWHLAGVLLRTQGNEILSLNLFGWAVLQKAAIKMVVYTLNLWKVVWDVWVVLRLGYLLPNRNELSLVSLDTWWLNLACKSCWSWSMHNCWCSTQCIVATKHVRYQPATAIGDTDWNGETA